MSHVCVRSDDRTGEWCAVVRLTGELEIFHDDAEATIVIDPELTVIDVDGSLFANAILTIGFDIDEDANLAAEFVRGTRYLEEDECRALAQALVLAADRLGAVKRRLLESKGVVAAATGPNDSEEEGDDDGCPVCDPDCLGNAEDCHDACERSSEEATDANG